MIQQYGLTLKELLEWETKILDTQKEALANAVHSRNNKESYDYYMKISEVADNQYSLLKRLIQQAKGE